MSHTISLNPRGTAACAKVTFVRMNLYKDESADFMKIAENPFGFSAIFISARFALCYIFGMEM